MPLLACNNDNGKCGHEFESQNPKASCDWCGGTTFIASRKTGLEVMLGIDILEGVCHVNDED